MKHQLRRLRGWLLSLVPVLSLACAGETMAPQPEPQIQTSCNDAGQCMTCYIYDSNTECVKEQ